MATYDYDLFTIGGGSGGVRASRMAAQFGAKVGIAEEYRYGGTCVIRGCVPKKLFVYASKFSEEFEDAAGFGWTSGEASFSWPTLIANKDREIDRLNNVYINILKNNNVEIFQDRAVLKDAHTVHLVNENRDITADKILIAVGAWPNKDDALPGVEHTITSNEAFHLERLPNRILIAGGGYIAVEFACIFNGLGVDTTLLYRREEILRGFDDDLRRTLHIEMEKKGVKVVTQNVMTNIEQKRGPAGEPAYDVSLTDGRVIEVDLVMFAIGRDPKTSGMGLVSAGVELDEKGAIKVDQHSQTSIPNIYAVGDVTDRAALTPVAIREGAAFAETVFNNNPIAVDHTCIPTAVFSQPEIGTVGLTEAEAVEKYSSVHIYKSTFRPMKHTLSGRDEKTLMKLIVDADTDKVVGVHLLGPDSGELVQVIGIALKMGATKAQFDEVIAVHPTAAEELVTMREFSVAERPRGAERDAHAAS